MERVILIKYGELTTKKGNRSFFVNTLYKNIKSKLEGIEVSISKDISRMYIEFHEEDLEEIKARINCVFGIHAYHVAYIIDTDIDTIKEKSVEAMKEFSNMTFKVSVKRSDKSFEANSMEMNQILGGCILKNIPNMKVDVHNPQVTLNVEILPYKTYLYTKTYYGLGGYPVGTQKKALLMLSGGIDSPVAGYLALKRGVKLDAVYFEAIPHTSIEARNKVISLSRKLSKYTDCINLHIIPFTELQEAIYKYVEPSYCITIMRRMMYRIMERLLKKHKGLAIVNGESIGQVASQTLTSMSVINEVTNVPVIRPVACMDKLEIIDVAKKIDTYDISILPFEDCCTVFVPKHPVINPNSSTCEKEESTFDYNKYIDDIIHNEMIIKITEKDNNEFEDLF